MTSVAAVPLTGGGKSGITGAGAVAAASPAVAGLPERRPLWRGSRRFVAWLAVRRVVELREAQRGSGAGARFFTV